MKRAICLLLLLLLGLTTLLPADIYRSWWWMALWCLAVVYLLAEIIKSHMWRNPGLLGVHASLAVIALGGIVSALTTHHTDIFMPYGCSERFFGEYALPQALRLDSITGLTAQFTAADGSALAIAPNRPGHFGGDMLIYMQSVNGGVWLKAVSDPCGGTIIRTGYAILALLMPLCCIKGRRERRIGVLSTGLFAISCASLGIWLAVAGPQSPLLASPWLAVHVALLIAAYLLLLATWVLAVSGSGSQWLRPLLLGGTYLLTMGIASGSLWAEVSWGRLWSWDPKETWALVSLGVYLMPLHFSYTERGRRKYLILAPVVLIVTFFGVNHMQSLHAYLK